MGVPDIGRRRHLLAFSSRVNACLPNDARLPGSFLRPGHRLYMGRGSEVGGNEAFQLREVYVRMGCLDPGYHLPYALLVSVSAGGVVRGGYLFSG